MKKILIIMTLSILILLFDKVKADTITLHNTQDILGSEWGNPNQGWGVYEERSIPTATTYDTSFQVQNGIIGGYKQIVISGYIRNIEYTPDELECDTVTSNGCEKWSLGERFMLEFKLWAGGWAAPCKIEVDDTNVNEVNTIYWQGTCPWNGNGLIDTFYYRIRQERLNSVNNIYLGINKYIQVIQDTGQATTNAIQDQTQQQQQQYNGFMNSNQTYEDKQDTNIKGVNETMEFEQAESDLLESLDTNTSFIDSIVINPQASVFIWDIMEVLRNMNPAIILLMGSMLGFGIIKLVLNR